jgi:hypothetical protein
MGTESVHDCRTRAAHHRRQDGAFKAALLAAALFLSPLALPPGHAETVAAADYAAKLPDLPAGDANVAHEIAITIVAPGREGFELSARLMEGGGLIERPVAWRVTDQAGETVYDAETPTADFAAPPGDYMVDIHYGAAHFQRSVSLLEGNRLGVSFVLNVGAIRVLPRLKNIGLPASPSHSRVFALSGRARGELVLQSAIPGEILRVPAGDYRVESRFDSGNAVAVADVKVKPGIMSAVEIDHAAGLARLAFVGAPDADVAWNIATETGEPLAAVSGLSADIVLKPGTYVASARTHGEVLTAKFAIGEGEARDIILGN